MKERKESEETTEALFERYVMSNYGRYPVAMAKGEGMYVWDEEGKKYLDFGAGIAVCSLGHCHPRMTAAIGEQAGKLVHCSNLYWNRNQGLLAERITEFVMGGEAGKVFFCNSGAEANEALVKLARKFGKAAPQEGGEARYEVITFANSFHGRTMAGISATAQAKVKEGFAPLLPGFKHVDYNDVEALRSAISAETAAILLEVVQGEGGIHAATPEFLEAVAALCAEHDLLILMDEVQCGLGRTGDLCAWRSIEGGSGIVPDAVSWAKGLAGGFPMGAIWAGEKVCDLLGPGTHGSTFGGGPLACAAALAVLEEIEEAKLMENAKEQGAYLRSEIESWASGLIRETRGLGLMVGLVIDGAVLEGVPGYEAGVMTPSAFVVRQLMAGGMLTVPAGADVVRLLPPLNVSRAEADEALAILKGVVQQIEKEAKSI